MKKMTMCIEVELLVSDETLNKIITADDMSDAGSMASEFLEGLKPGESGSTSIVINVDGKELVNATSKVSL